MCVYIAFMIMRERVCVCVACKYNKWKGPGDGDLIIIENQVNGEKARPHLGYKAATASAARRQRQQLFVGSRHFVAPGYFLPLRASFARRGSESDGWLEEI